MEGWREMKRGDVHQQQQMISCIISRDLCSILEFKFVDQCNWVDRASHLDVMAVSKPDNVALFELLAPTDPFSVDECTIAAFLALDEPH
jgi:hypothetical protein